MKTTPSLLYPFFISLFIGIGVNSFSQKGCKLDKSNDDFDSVQIIKTEMVKLKGVWPLSNSKQPWDLFMNFQSQDSSLEVIITHKSLSVSSKINSIFLKLEDGTIIKKESPQGDRDYTAGSDVEYTFTSFDLSKDQLKKLANSKIQKFRVVFSYFSDYPVVEEELKDKRSDKLLKDADCLVKELKL